MEFTAIKDSFLKAAQNVMRAVPSRTPRPELGGILLTAKADRVTLSGTDSELGIKCQFNAQINVEGEALLPGCYLVDILRRMPPGELSLRSGSSNEHIFITSGASKFELLTLPNIGFPPLEQGDKAEIASLPELELRTGINQVSFAAARDGLRQLLNSVLVSLNGGKMRFVATDGHRLALADTLELGEDITGDYLVPVRSLEEVARLVSGGDEVKIAASQKQISFQTKNILVISRLVDGKYLPYESVIPTEFSWRASVDRSDFLAALERAQVFCAQTINAVNLRLHSDGIEVFAQNADVGRVQELVTAKTSGGELEIAFNVNYLIEPLRMLLAETVQLEFTGPESAALLTPLESKNYKYLVMPITTRTTA